MLSDEASTVLSELPPLSGEDCVLYKNCVPSAHDLSCLLLYPLNINMMFTTRKLSSCYFSMLSSSIILKCFSTLYLRVKLVQYVVFLNDKLDCLSLLC